MSYESKATPTVIKFSSRASVKIKDSFYTLEYGEERSLNCDYSEYNLDEEIHLLTDHCNSVVDKQIEELCNSL